MTVEERPVSQRAFTAVFVALIALAGISWGLSYLRLGAVGAALAIGIAAAKAILVALYFMELSRQRASNRVVILVGLAMALTLVAFTTADVLTREPPPMLPPRQALP